MERLITAGKFRAEVRDGEREAPAKVVTLDHVAAVERYGLEVLVRQEGEAKRLE